MLADVVHDRGLQAREREVVGPVGQRPRERDGLRVAVEADPVDHRPARVAEAEVAGDLVVGLAGGVVDGAAEHGVATVVLPVDDHRVPAGHEEHDDRQLEGGVLEHGGVEVGLEVVHGHERHVPDQRQGLRRGDADEQRADEAGPVGGGDGVDLGVGDAGLHDGLGDHRVQHLDVGTGGDLGDDAAVAGVAVDLAGDHRGQLHLAVADHGRRGLVAGALDAEDRAHGGEVSVGHVASSSVGVGSDASISSRRAR